MRRGYPSRILTQFEQVGVTGSRQLSVSYSNQSHWQVHDNADSSGSASSSTASFLGPNQGLLPLNRTDVNDFASQHWSVPLVDCCCLLS